MKTIIFIISFIFISAINLIFGAQTFTFDTCKLILDGNFVGQDADLNPSELANSSGYFIVEDNEITDFSIFIDGVLLQSGSVTENVDGGWVSTNTSIDYNTFRIEGDVLIFSTGFSVIQRIEDFYNDEWGGIMTVRSQFFTISTTSDYDIILYNSFKSVQSGGAWDYEGYDVLTHAMIPIDYDTNGKILVNFNNSDYSYYNSRELGFFNGNTQAGSLSSDTDNDGILDFHETNTGIFISSQNTGTNPNNPDTDNDGLLDGSEINIHNTSPLSSDSDGDNLSDPQELFTYNTNPNLADTNGDQINDGLSISNGIDPNGDYSSVVSYLSAYPENFNLFTQAAYDAIVSERDARPTQEDYDAIVVERDARPTQAAYDAIVSERDARPTQAAYDAMVVERDARPTQAAYDAMVVERDARPTQAAYDAMVSERDARPTQEDYDSLSHELTTLNNRVYDVLPKITPERPIFDYQTTNLYLSEAKQEIDNSREYNLNFYHIDSDILSLEDAIEMSDFVSINSLLDNLINQIDSTNLSSKVLYDFSVAKANFELAKIYLSIGDLGSVSNRINDGKLEIENSRSFDTTYNFIDSDILEFENALLQEDLDIARDVLDEIIYDLEYSSLPSEVMYDFSLAKVKFESIHEEISYHFQVLDNYDPTPIPIETLESYIVGLNQEIEEAQIVIDQKLSIEEVKDLRIGSTMIEVSGNQATVQLQMEESSDLESWQDSGVPASMTIPAETNTKFFRFKMAD